MANKPEDICVPLEMAKRLQEAGIVIDTVWYWIKRSDTWILTNNDCRYSHCVEKWLGESERILYPAPTADEFDYTELPDVVIRDGVVYTLRITKALNHWRINYCNHNSYDKSICLIEYDKLGDDFPENEHKLCEVLAMVAIWLKQNIKSGGLNET